MKKNNFLWIAVITLFLGFTSCTSDSDTSVKKTTVKEDKENIKATVDNFYSCLETLSDGGFADMFYNATIGSQETVIVKDEYVCGYEEDQNGDYILDNQGNPIEKKCPWDYPITTDSHLDNLSYQFEEQYGSLSKNEGFDYTGAKGKYTWNNTTKKWGKESSDKIEVLFPSDPTKTTNNTKLVFDSYEDQATSFGKDKPRLPKKAHMLVTVDNKRTFEVTVSDVVYDVKTNITIPTSAKVEIFTNPFTSILTVKRNTETEFQVNFDLNSNGGCGYSLHNLVTLKNNDYDNIKSEKDFESLKGHFSHNALKVKYNVDIEGFNKLGKETVELSETEINNIIDAEVLYNGVKISDLTYDETDEENPIILIYKDGTKESGRNYVPDFDEKIKNIFKRFIDGE